MLSTEDIIDVLAENEIVHVIKHCSVCARHYCCPWEFVLNNINEWGFGFIAINSITRTLTKSTEDNIQSCSNPYFLC